MKKKKKKKKKNTISEKVEREEKYRWNFSNV